jgi:apolipoprotein D and lipocalin family protein
MGAAASRLADGPIQPLPPLQPVAYLDLQRYSGRWWQVALLPNSFQRSDARNVTATYTPSTSEHNTLYVQNDSYDSTGFRTWITGRATIDPAAASTDTTESPGRLLVYFEPNETQPFVWPLGAPYWVIELGSSPDYGHAVVTDPMRRNLWILSRTPQLPADTLKDILGRLVRVHGFSADRLANIVWTNNT